MRLAVARMSPLRASEISAATVQWSEVQIYPAVESVVPLQSCIATALVVQILEAGTCLAMSSRLQQCVSPATAGLISVEASGDEEIQLALRCASVAVVEQILTAVSVAVQSSSLHHHTLAAAEVQTLRVALAVLLSSHPRYFVRAAIAERFEGAAWHVVTDLFYKSVN